MLWHCEDCHWMGFSFGETIEQLRARHILQCDDATIEERAEASMRLFSYAVRDSRWPNAGEEGGAEL